MSGSFPNINDIIAPVTVDWGLEHNTFNFVSFNNISQSVSIPGARWRGSMSFEFASDQEAIDLELFIEALEGRAGRFCVFNPKYKTYPEAGTPNVNAPNQVGTVLTTQGWLASRLVLRKGQFFNFNHELKRATEDIYSDATGVATLRFYPRIRVAPAVNVAIVTSRPYMLASLNSDYNPIGTDADLSSRLDISFMEAIYDR